MGRPLKSRKPHAQNVKNKRAFKTGLPDLKNIVGICPVQHKRQYRVKRHAIIANQHIPGKARYYKCPHCNFWHATTTAKL